MSAGPDQAEKVKRLNATADGVAVKYAHRLGVNLKMNTFRTKMMLFLL